MLPRSHPPLQWFPSSITPAQINAYRLEVQNYLEKIATLQKALENATGLREQILTKIEKLNIGVDPSEWATKFDNHKKAFLDLAEKNQDEEGWLQPLIDQLGLDIKALEPQKENHASVSKKMQTLKTLIENYNRLNLRIQSGFKSHEEATTIFNNSHTMAHEAMNNTMDNTTASSSSEFSLSS
ncbi:MAG: hypothetical protein WC748_10295 [Legionellales bacterium]|jgi:hypothetical protein